MCFVVVVLGFSCDFVVVLLKHIDYSEVMTNINERGPDESSV